MVIEAQKRSTGESRIITVGNLKLNYEVMGEGPRLLLIGGTGWDLRAPKSPFERALHKEFTVLRYDQRGQGQSDKPDIAYSMQDYADDCAHLLAALAWQEVPVIGISFGGMVAQHFALRYPQHVSRLVLACTSSGGEGGASYPIHELQKLAPEEYAARFLLLANRSRDAAWQARNPQMHAAMLTEMCNARLNMSVEDKIGLQRQLAARLQHDTWARLPQLRMPVLVCGGEFDDICPAENLRNLASQIPDVELQIFRGGHGFYMEDQQAGPYIREFLAAGAIK